MLSNYVVEVASLSTLSLVWRAVLLDHQAFALRVRRIPLYIGSALYCGFCFPLWLSLFGVLIFNPLPAYPLLLAWLSVGAGVLVLRNATAALMEANGVLTALHRKNHE